MKKNRTKKLGKLGLIAVVLIACSVIASATLLTFFGKIETTVNIEQSVQIDGNNWNEAITHDLDGVGGCCYCFEHEIVNNGCQPIMLDWEIWANPNMDGITVSFIREPYLGSLDLSVLDGMAEYDDFDVYVDDILVYTYSATGGDEIWILHTVDLLPFEIPAAGTHTVKIDCIADEPWQYFDTYGQLGVDTIELYCELGTLCDSVDIGDTSSEAGHNLVGWGPVEPATSGGNWGGITDCRATWVTGDESWASVDLTCEESECDCDGIPIMEEPFELLPEETIEFCICYGFDMLIKPGTYTIKAKLIPTI